MHLPGRKSSRESERGWYPKRSENDIKGVDGWTICSLSAIGCSEKHEICSEPNHPNRPTLQSVSTPNIHELTNLGVVYTGITFIPPTGIRKCPQKRKQNLILPGSSPHFIHKSMLTYRKYLVTLVHRGLTLISRFPPILSVCCLSGKRWREHWSAAVFSSVGI